MAGKFRKKMDKNKDNEKIENINGQEAVIFELKRMQEELHQYSHMISCSTDMLQLLNKDYAYITANAAYLKEFNFTSDQLIGCTVAEIFGEELFKKVVKPNADRCLAGEEVKYQDWFEFPVSGKKFMEMIYYPYIGIDNNIQGFIVRGRDVTTHRRAEEEVVKTILDLVARVKELECLYAFSRVVEGASLSGDELFKKVVGLIPPSWQYPDIACARIIVEGREYRTDNFKETKWKQLSEIFLKGNAIGSIEVCYLKEMPFRYDGPFSIEERKLLDALAGRLGEIVERFKVEEELLVQKEALEQKNMALREILEQIEIEKQKIKDNVAANAEEVLLPALDKLKIKGAATKHLAIIKDNLKDLASSFGKTIGEKRFKLTPREIEICNMIKGGMTSKDIANLQNLSLQTVEKHRSHIRKKLGISNKDYNLTSYLQSI